jgi:hypothetical protein
LSIDPPGGLGALETSLAVRPEYPVSTFLYDRRSFRWFIGITANIVASGFAIYGLAAACTVVTGGATVVACLAGAVGVVGAVYGLISASSSGQVVTHDLELGDMNEVAYVNSFGGNGRRSIGERDQVMDDEIKQLLRKALGQDYTFEGHIPVDDKRHLHLIAANEGRPVPVHSFTSSAGIRFHQSKNVESDGYPSDSAATQIPCQDQGPRAHPIEGLSDSSEIDRNRSELAHI